MVVVVPDCVLHIYVGSSERKSSVVVEVLEDRGVDDAFEDKIQLRRGIAYAFFEDGNVCYLLFCRLYLKGRVTFYVAEVVCPEDSH